jgi:protein-S-isoprenylcysteine O-methyltransferase Ste14
MSRSRGGDVTLGGVIGRLLYGGLFVAVVPLALAAWAIALEPVVPLRIAAAPALGAGATVAGLALLTLGIVDLIKRGRGLPMNAFPPALFVRVGIYRWLRNPIYIGFGLLMTGVSLATASASGLWVVTPVTVLGMLALVWGYERHDLLARFGPACREAPLLSFPRSDARRPSGAERAAVYLWVFAPWLIAVASLRALAAVSDASAFEPAWPVVQWTALVYVSAYPFVLTAPLVALSGRGLRRLATSGAAGTVVITLLWLVVPVMAVSRPFDADGVLGHLLTWLQGTSRGGAAFPVFWSLVVGELWADNGRVSGRTWWPVLGWSWAVAIAASALTTDMHTWPEVLAAVVVFGALRDPDATLAATRRATERLANSWREWRIGPVRVINHGAYAAAAAGGGTLVAGSALGANPEAVVWVGLCILVGAGAWAQWLEGSSRLLRPFGWYGGVLGATAGAWSAAMAGVPLAPLMAAFACAAPFIQIFGRLRCLVNGCCHGGPAPPTLGIRYVHRRSRVAQMARLAGVPLHPTPLYSIAGNLLIGLGLVRLRALGAADVLVIGLYLILSGMARFVEESYRAEPQTRIVAGLHIYQWLAVGQALAGIVTTTLPSTARAGGFTLPSPPLLAGAVVMALLAGAAMGVDFPRSNRRFSRLADAD